MIKHAALGSNNGAIGRTKQQHGPGQVYNFHFSERLGRPAEKERKAKLFVLVITAGERKYGLIVDALEGEEELVIKALDDQTFSTDLVSGASILGDGRVVLILNLPAIVEHVGRWRQQETGEAHSGLLLTATDRSRLAVAPGLSTAAGGQA